MATRISAALQKPKRIATSLSELRYLVFEGMKGDTGDSAYEEAVQLGFVGTEAEWIASLKGEQGEPGKAKSAYLDDGVVRLVEDDTIYTSLLMQTDIDNGILPFVISPRENESSEEYFELDHQAISAASPVIHFRSKEHLLAVDSTGHFTLTDRPQGGGSTIYATPEQFGAVGDGVTDDTAAVRQAMQNPAVALHNTYKVTEAISCVANVVVGNGDAKILASGDCLNFSDNVVLSDFAIETPNQTDGVAIKAQKDISAERLAITGGRIGIRVEGSYYKTVVRGCTFKNLWGDSAAAVHVLFAGITEFIANLVEGVSNDLDRDADGIRIWQSKGVENVCAEIHGNEFHNCRGRFIKASTYNCSIRDNYCHNDSGFATITNAIGIDVQKGNSDVRNNMILASSGINISVRVDDVSHHIVEHNTFKLVESSGSNPHLRAISVTDYGDATTKTDVTIRENYIDWGNNVSIYLPYVGNSIIRALSNHVVGRQGDAVSFRGTFDATCRFEMLGNLNDEYTYFARFSGCIPNVLGDRKIFAADPIAFSSVLPMTSYVANTTALDGFGNTAFLETLGGVSSFSIQLSTNSQFGVYKTNGQAVYYFAGAYVNKVNGKTGVVTLTASDVGALPDSTVIPTVPQMAAATDMTDWTSGKTVDAAVLKADFQSAGQSLALLRSEVSDLDDNKADKNEIPTAVSELTNDSGFQTAAQVQSAIAAAAELPSGGTTGDFLRKDANGNAAWETVQIREPRITMTAQDTTATLDPNKFYVFPEMASLAPSLATPTDATIVNEYHFMFTSGATAATLTIPATINQPDGFTVEANHVYEVSILEGCMTAQGWAVS